MSVSVPIARQIDPRGQRFGAGASAIVLLAATALGVSVLPVAWLAAPAVGVTLGVSAALGTRYFVFGRPWPLARDRLALGKPRELEPEIPPRFAQALGATVLGLATLAFVAGFSLGGWALTLAVAGLQTLLAVTGYCLGCQLYGLKWYVPALFDRILGVPPAVQRTPLRLVRVGRGEGSGGR